MLNAHEFPLSLDINTMFSIRKWERFQFLIEYEAQQVPNVVSVKVLEL
jgi:hypothetical protein